MPCPLRVALATTSAVVVGGLMLWEVNNLEEIEQAGGRWQVAKNYGSRFGAAMRPGNMWAMLRRRPYFLVPLLALHVDMLLCGFAGTTLLLGQERVDAIALSAAPLVALWPSVGDVGGGHGRPVIAGSGCYWEKGRAGGVPPHVCTYEAEVCCPAGCEDAGGRWIWGEAAPAADNESGRDDAPTQGAAAGFATLICSKGCASVDCGGGAE
jgi:hypothetical protein